MSSAKKVSIRGLDKAAVLAALYNASHPQGMGFLHADPNPMTVEEAQKLLKAGDDTAQMFGIRLHGDDFYFDYVKGRVLKVDLSADEFNPWGYDRDNGEGAAEAAISTLRTSNDVNPIESQKKFENATFKAALNLLK